MEEQTFEEFLRQRQISEETIHYFKNENIDAAAIQIMDDHDLQKWIPRFGDRLAIKNFCKNTIAPKKLSLLERLRNTIANKNNSLKRTSVTLNNDKQKLSRKSTRSVEIGWLVYSKKEKRFTQVRQNSGGGTRKICMEKTSSCREVLEKAKELFFPNNVSVKGPIDSFEISLLDFKQNTIDIDMTIERIFEITALTKLRFYMATQLKEGVSLDNDDGSDDWNNFSSKIGPSTSTTNCSFIEIENEIDNPLPSTSTDFDNNNILTFYNNYDYENSLLSEEHLDIQGNIEGNTIDLSSDIPDNEYGGTVLILHRGKIFEEFMEAFKQDFFHFHLIQIQMVLPNGENESAEDMGGVLRDAITEYWESFYEKCTVGTNFKVPYLRHDFGEKEWKTVAKILMKGWQDHRYLPIKLAPVFMQHCFNKTVEIDQEAMAEELIRNFLNYIGESESETLKMALSNFCNVDNDDLLEVFSSYDSKWLPTEKNLKQLVVDIAHKELVQKPAFVIRCFQQITQKIHIDLKKVYNELNPTAKNITSKLSTKKEVLSYEESQVFGYLKKFIKEADFKTRSSFLRYCTGSDLINRNIEIDFKNLEGFGRAPIAHTCNGVLELPTSYENFVTFRNEFNHILQSNIWVMDII